MNLNQTSKDILIEFIILLLNKVSSLISLKIQKENFVEEYKNRPIRIATKEEK